MSRANKEKTKEFITDIAIKLFKKDGFLNTSTLDVARNAKVAHGTIFFHFPTRYDLIIASVYKEMNTIAMDLNTASRGTDDVRKLCAIFLDGIDEHKEFYSNLVRDLPNLPLDVQRMVFASLSAFSIHFVDTIELAQGKNKVREFPPKYAMFFWFGVVNYILSYDRLLEAGKFTKKDKRELVDFFMASLTNLNYKSYAKTRSKKTI